MTSIIVSGLAMWVTEWLKRKKRMDKLYVPVVAFVAAGLFAVGWYSVFEPGTSWRFALKEGLALGAVTGGLYGFGKTLIEKKSSSLDEKN
ncbi:MAG: hypothetical protein ACOY30_06015 [Bacillota bacterium]